MGLSAGGMEALKNILPALPAFFPVPLIVAQHIAEDSEGFWIEYLKRTTLIRIKEAEDKEPIQDAHVYFAPAGYHLLIEQDRTFSLSADPRVNYSCPSIDVLFESAADVFRGALIGVVLTGANRDGSYGLQAIKAKGGCTIVQNPRTAKVPTMPQACLERTTVDHTINLEELVPLLTKLSVLKKGEEYVADISFS